MSFRLFFLVLAVPFVCQAQNITDAQENMTTEASTTLAPAGTNTTALLTPSPHNHTSSNQTAQTQEDGGESVTISNDQRTTTVEDVTGASEMVPSSTTESASAKGTQSSTWGYILLVLLLLVILILLVILYLLRRASRRYSFDLRRAAPVRNTEDPAGTFEAICLDEEDQLTPKDGATPGDLSVFPTANGLAPQSQENAQEEDANVNHLKDIGDSNWTIPDHQVETPDSLALRLNNSDKDNASPYASTDLLDGMELNELLPFNQIITSPESSSSSSY
ncbi:uncharacterized protein LOC133661807 [Entelurus aequoreus]|uniref:uncharacterized protein LOC133661807 n=1 Tax=Entelurus aequoreus TaxID=161455 RepID=UPI002B1E7382|nr:uncharacterized protein LOC133661807 [Entelurus aequoreus]